MTFLILLYLLIVIVFIITLPGIIKCFQDINCLGGRADRESGTYPGYRIKE